MDEEFLRAGVQYNDFSGTVAFDWHDSERLDSYLVNAGKMTKAERIVGLRLAFAENSAQSVQSIGVVAYVCYGAFDDGPPETVREVEVSLPPSDVLGFFKRFDLMAIQKGVDLAKTNVS